MIVRLCIALRSRWELAAAALIVVLVTLAVASGSYFDRDDLFFAQYFGVNPVTPEVLVRSWFGHLMPGYIASVIAFLEVFGLSWPAALAGTALIHAGAFVAFTRCLDAVLGPARLNILAGLAFSLSLGPLSVRLWWAATLNNMLALALGLAVLGCATRWMTTRRSRHLIAALLIYAIALAMSEKNLLFSLHIAMWCALVVWRGRPIRDRLREVLRTWPLWVGLAVLSLVDVVAFLTGQYVDESGSSPSVPFSIDFIVHSVFGGLVPSLFGVEMVNETTSLLDLRVVITVLLFAAFVAWTVVRVRSNGGVWIFAAIAVLANAAVLSRRGEMITVAGGRQLRYLLESSALLWLAIGVVLLVTLRAGRRDAHNGRSARTGRVGASAVASVLVLVLALSTWSWAITLVRTVQASGGYAARAWVASLEDTLPAPAPPIIDSPLPPSFGMPAMHPYNSVSLLLPSLGWESVQTTPVLDGAWVVGPDGVAGPAVVEGADVQFSGRRCTEDGTDIPMPEVHTTGDSYLIVDLVSGSGDSMAFVYDGGWTTIDRPIQSGTLAVYLPYTLDGDLSISPQGGTMCIASVAVGDVLPGVR